MNQPLERRFLSTVSGYLASLPFDLKVLFEAKDDPDLDRVLARLRTPHEEAVQELGSMLSAIQRATLYLSHHGRVTCVESGPMCHICPLRSRCPYPEGTAA